MAHSPLSWIMKAQLGGLLEDDFDSEPTSVLDLTQCISPPLQTDVWAEKQAAMLEEQQLLAWQHQQNILYEQQRWEEQQQLCIWEQNESEHGFAELQYLYEHDPMNTCNDFSYQSDHCGFQDNQQQGLPFESFDDSQFMLDSWISSSGNHDGLNSIVDDSIPSSYQKAFTIPSPADMQVELDSKFQADVSDVRFVKEEDEAKHSMLTNLPSNMSNMSNIIPRVNLYQPQDIIDQWYVPSIEDTMCQMQPSVSKLQFQTHPYPSPLPGNGNQEALPKSSMDAEPHLPSLNPTLEKSASHKPSAGDESCMSDSLNSVAKQIVPATPVPRKATSNGSNRSVTLAELASGGVKMGGVQLPNVGTQIPSVIRLNLETQASGMGGVRMVQLLLACAEAVACRDSRQANILLQQLQHMATPYGDAMQRITVCFVEGLTARLAITGSQPFKFRKAQGPRKPPSEREKLKAFQLVYRASPFLAFGHLAANSAILEAFEKEDRLHIVDLGMSHALQWPYLIHDLANRQGGPPRSLRITGFGLSSAQLKEAGEELVEIAKSRNIPFEFRAVTESLESMQPSMLELREGEALAVNSVLQLHCVVKESRGSLNAVLKTIHELSPKILTLVEQDASHNGPFFLGRFMEALHYYSAIFDSLDVILPRNCPYRVKMEQFHFAEEIKNIVSCEGPARVERHERVDQWRRKMSRANFQPLPLKFLNQARMWLSHYNCDGYTLSEEKGCLVIGWKGKPIIAASSWKG